LRLKTGFKSQAVWNEFIKNALIEDGAWTDRTSLGLKNNHKKVHATILSKQDLVIAGLEIAAQTFHFLMDGPIVWMTETEDGEKVKAGSPVARLQAEAWAVLAAERTVLNFLQRLSGIATLTRTYVDRIKDTKAKIVDTRKTTPCLRILEKFAVRCGGGTDHRFGLHDGCLIKDNHIRFAGSIKKAVDSIRGNISHLWRIEVEVETLQQVEELLGLGHGERWLELAGYLLMGNTSASLGVINQAAWDGTDLRQLHRQTLRPRLRGNTSPLGAAV